MHTLSSDEIRKRLPRSAARLLDMEQRYVWREADGNRLSHFSTNIDSYYWPESGEVIALDAWWLPVDSCVSFAHPSLPPDISRLFFTNINGCQCVLLLVHPLSRSYYSKYLSHAVRAQFPVWGLATSSIRTLFAYSPEHEIVSLVKLSLAANIEYVERSISSARVARSIGVSMLLAGAAAELPSSFDFFPEYLGLYPRRMRRGGMLVRGLPLSSERSECMLVPFFALFAGARLGQEPLLIKISRAAGLTPFEFIDKILLRRFAEQWLALALDGIVFEPHAQNLLLELGAEWKPTGRIIHRDFEDCHVDVCYRQSTRRFVPSQMPVCRSVRGTYDQRGHSSWLSKNLTIFYQGGVLFCLQQMHDVWWDHVPPGICSAVPDLETLFRKHLCVILQNSTGATINCPHSDSELARVIRWARRREVMLSQARKTHVDSAVGP